MDNFDRPSNGIRELATGMEDVLFGPGGYQWFLEANAKDFERNDRRGKMSAKRAQTTVKQDRVASPATPYSVDLDEEIETRGRSKRAQVKPRVSKKSARKRVESSPTTSEPTQHPTTASPPQILESTNVGDNGSVIDIEGDEVLPMDRENDDEKDFMDQGEEDEDGADEVGDEEEVDEIDSSTSQIQEGSSSAPSCSPSPVYDRSSTEKSPTFPLTRARVPSVVPSPSGGTRRSPVVNRMYVDLAGPSERRKMSPARKGPQKLGRGNNEAM